MADSSSYHHGDLKAALLRHAEVVIEQTGYEQLELRELAALAGVSRSAPYRHFENRIALLTAVSIKGFQQLDAAYAAIAARPGSARARLMAVVMHYLGFAAAQPQLFRLMFVSNIYRSHGEPPEWTKAATRSFEIMEGLMAETMPGAAADSIRSASLALWTTKYGYALLRMNGRFQSLLTPGLDEEAVLRQALKQHIPD